jgi:hypothetical protein
VNSWYVYTLAYLDGTVFYVGKGTGRRVHNHEHFAARSDEMIQRYHLNDRKCSKIREIWDKQGQVKKEILYETDDEQDAYIYEWALVNIVYANNENLTNNKTSNRRNLTTAYQTLEISGEIYYTAAQAARYLGISKSSFDRKVRDKLRAYKRAFYRKGEYFRLSDLEEYL